MRQGVPPLALRGGEDSCGDPPAILPEGNRLWHCQEGQSSPKGIAHGNRTGGDESPLEVVRVGRATDGPLGSYHQEAMDVLFRGATVQPTEQQTS